MSSDTITLLRAMVGQEITLRFAGSSLSGRLTDVEQQPWGYMLKVLSPVGEHFIPYPGQVMHLVVGRRL